MRKQPQVSPPETIAPKQPASVITQVREYQLITPLYGGGVAPTEADPITVVRATEIRGHLRFWWRACRGGQFNGLSAMKQAEDEIWGKAYKKGEEPVPHEETIQITIDVDSLKKGQPLKPFKIVNRRAKPDNDIPSYAAFPLQPDRDELQKRDPFVPDVQSNVSFTMTISFPKERRKDVEAALWAWETFGGIGARTRRGFGALRLLKIDRVDYTDLPYSNTVEQWINDKLVKFVEQGTPPTGVSCLSRSLQFAVTPPYGNVMRAWKKLIDELRNFRQARPSGRSIWPEADAIREMISIGDEHSEESSHPHKFPRAAFGLPIIFHFKDGYPEDTTLKEAGEKKERFASPLILRPLLCRDNRAVGLALLLEGSRVALDNLVLVEDKEENKHPVQGMLTESEARNIPVLKGETDVLQAFMQALKGGR